MSAKKVFGELYEELNQELLNILEFWSLQSVDQRNGGFVGRIDHYGKIDFNAPKGAVLNTRILWAFSAAYRMIGSEKLEKLANRASEYIKTYFWDEVNGGLYWELDSFGNPLNTRKQAYAQGFGIYAFSEHYLATGDNSSLEYAQKLYRLLETHFRDDKFGGYIEALDKDWNPLEDMRLSEKEDNLPKSMNTHLHILEPYTNLYRAWPDERLKTSLEHLLDIFQNRIINPSTGHFTLLFEMDWARRCDIVSFGHEIEGAWLLHEAAFAIQSESIILEMEKTAIRLVENALGEGTYTDGSLFYEKEGDRLDTDKHWWPQAEAMVGLMNAWEITQNEKYLKALERVWNFVKEGLIDYENGEWYSRVDQKGIPYEEEDKVGLWKCPYHNGRAMMEIIRRIKEYTVNES
ncbi:AGE family epimerase/isomerase [Maribellus sp. CM-23]|uniref:AGE family epimerase/isomerase n=1 Tax=Maribellus sp. CM-23 TaxID=2781026 RepID=UPI001F1F0EB8|nr:AGE family epimerase/isomerase [Maribellus sp. CM-23]MCE4564819.1 AGE family epimerase/isomerase [Maribellus sp. CM-23]